MLSTASLADGCSPELRLPAAALPLLEQLRAAGLGGGDLVGICMELLRREVVRLECSHTCGGVGENGGSGSLNENGVPTPSTSSTAKEPAMTAVSHATFMDLPRDVLRIVLRHVPRGWHGVLKHVNRQLRDTVRAFEEEESRVNQIDMTVVCSSRHTVEWAVRQRCPWDSRTACAIAETGDCELLQWAQDGVPHQPHDLNWDCNVWVSASISGNLEMLQYIKTEDLASREDALDEAVEEAAARGQLCVLQWMNEEFSKPDDEWTSAAMYVAAAESGHVPVLQWMKEQQIPLHEPCKWYVCAVAAREGHLHAARWAREELASPWNCKLEEQSVQQVLEERAEDVDSEGLVDTQNYPYYVWRCHFGTCEAAACGGHLDVLQWARASGAPWDEWTTAKAAQGGHYQVLEWAVSNGAPLTERAAWLVARKGNIEGLRRLQKLGCPVDDTLYDGAVHAWVLACWGERTREASVEVMKWAEQSGVKLNKPRVESMLSTLIAKLEKEGDRERGTALSEIVEWLEAQP